jgi:glutamine---fructose-6-phosphate transaminase (isomerizing)
VILIRNFPSVDGSTSHNSGFVPLRGDSHLCSIIAYRGSGQAATILVNGLKKMEYRGYDSVGVSTLHSGRIETRKGVGKVAEVDHSLHLNAMSGSLGIGHTRWATHGGVSTVNAHPHLSNSLEIAIVHNGIIENYESIKQQLRAEGYIFKSQTDSEVIANLLQKNHELTRSVREAMLRTLSRLQGSYAFIAIFENGTIAAARYKEPLIVGLGQSAIYLSSDVLGFSDQADDAIFLGDKELVILGRSGMEILNFDGEPIQPTVTKIAHELLTVQKGEFSHFTLKEIFEQKATLLQTAEARWYDSERMLETLRECKNLYLSGSGTSYHAAQIGSFLLSKYARKRAEPLIASEAQYWPHFLGKDALLLAISQSGESADILNAVNLAKDEGTEIISIINSLTSSLFRESTYSIGLHCGPEVGVAATKSFTSQLVVMYRLASELSGRKINPDFREASLAISRILGNAPKIRRIAESLREASDVYVLGRGIHFPIALEGSLKIKEISYIHAEGLPGGELKHGSLALMHKDVSVILVNPEDGTYADTLTGAHEIKARGGKIIGISNVYNEMYDSWIEIPKVGEVMFPIIENVPLQLLAFYISLEKNADPDYPRNLAKCVTVR